MSFHEVLFPAAISLGSSGGPERRTEIAALASGFEERNATWAHSRRRYDAGFGVRSLDDVEEIIAFFEARLGMLYGFRWKDWTDFKSCPPSAQITPSDQPLGVGDGTATGFKLIKLYSSGPGEYRRPIRKPVEGEVRIMKDGVEQAVGSDFSVDATTGEVEFAAPPEPGAVLTAGFEFHVPVRFDADRIDVNLSGFEAGEIPSVPVIEVRI